MVPQRSEPTFADPPAIAARGIGKRFPGVVALDDVSFEVRRGEVHALVGQNGAGKSTLINILSGMLTPDAGTVLLDDRPAVLDGTQGAIRAGIATVYQELSLLPNLTLAQNLALGREPRRFGLLDASAMAERAGRALRRIGLSLSPDTRVSRLTLAERQLVEIAKALAGDPAVLILDEPTAPLGRAEAERLFGIVRELRGQGLAIIYVSHRFSEVLDLCDRATVLRNGRVVATTELGGWTEARLTETMLGGRNEVFRRSVRGMEGAPKLTAAGLTWGDRVRDVDLVARAGEIVVLTGLLGAGQNEIARLLGGDLAAESGTVTVDGRDLAGSGPGDAIAAGICLLTDDRKHEGILPNLTLRENIALPSLAARRAAGIFVDPASESSAVADARERLGVVAHSLEAPIRTLSGGNQQKALLARWVLADAEVFVLIEPTRGVDVAARAEIYRRLDAVARSGKAVVVVSSDVPEVLALADRIVVVRDGRIAGETRPEAVDEEGLNLMLQGAA